MDKKATHKTWIPAELEFEQNSYELNFDNKATVSLSENPIQYDRSKHEEVDRQFIKEMLEVKIIHIPFVRTKEQLADILTKTVGPKQFQDTPRTTQLERV